MLIDWFTVVAQVLNFLLLVWLMKRFLYQPVLDAIAAREGGIAAELADAAASRTEAHTQRDLFVQKNQTFDDQRAGLLQDARDAARTDGERLRDEARKTADAADSARTRTRQADDLHLRTELIRQTQDQVFDISRRVLGDLAATSLEERMCEVFIQRLNAADDQALVELGTALKATSEQRPALLRSAFELPTTQQAALLAALEHTFGQPIPLEFATAPELVSGIELSALGLKLAWSISDYLDALSSGLEQKSGQKAST